MRHRDKVSLRIAGATLGVAGLWLAFSRFVVRPVIEALYEGRGPAFLTRVFSGRDIHLVGFYLDAWQSLSTLLLALILGAGVLVLLAIRPEVQQRVDSWFGPPEQPRLELSSRRKVVVMGLIGFVIGASLLDMIFYVEHWPFSNYPMYASVQTPEFSRHRVFGFTESGAEIRLDIPHHLQPLDEPRLDFGFSRLLGPGSDFSQRNCSLAAGLLAHYERLRAEGAHDGPPLNGISIRELFWTMEPSAQNVDRPDATEVVCEFVEQGGGTP